MHAVDLVLATGTAAAGTAAGSSGAGSPGHGWEGGAGSWWPVFPVLWLLVVAAVVTFAVIWYRRSGRRAPVSAAEARLAERYATGDIGEGEYHERLVVLRESSRRRYRRT